MNPPRAGSGSGGDGDSPIAGARSGRDREVLRRPIDRARVARPLLDPIEAALRELAEALDGALDDVRAEVTALRSENEALRERLSVLEEAHASHRHPYAVANPGSSGVMWCDLGMIRSFLDGDLPNNENFSGMGVYLRGAPVVEGQPRPMTGPPSDEP